MNASGPHEPPDPARIQRKADELLDFLRDVEVVGYPKREIELDNLKRLVTKYPAEARQILDEIEGPWPASP